MHKILIAVPVLALALVACSDTSNYKSQTEEFIDKDAQVEESVGGDVSEAECAEPDSTEIGTTYSCTAQVENIGEVTFISEINAEDSFVVTPQP